MLKKKKYWKPEFSRQFSRILISLIYFSFFSFIFLFLTFFQTDSRKTGWNNLAICSIRELSGNCCRLWLDLLTDSDVRMSIEYCGRWKHREIMLNRASDAPSFTSFLSSFLDAVWLWFMWYSMHASGTQKIDMWIVERNFEMLNVENAREMRQFRRSVTNEMKFLYPQLAP